MTDDARAVLDFADRKTVLQTVAGFAVAGLILALLVDFVGTNDVLGKLAETDPGWLALACLSTLICLSAWGKSWQIVLRVAAVDERYSKLVVTYYAATFANYVTPLGQAGGEPFIAYVLSRDTEASYEDSLASVVTADLLNMLPFFTFSGIGFAALIWQTALPETVERLAAVLFALALGVPVLAAVGWRYRRRLGRTVLRLAAPITRRTDRFSLAALRGRLHELNEAFQRIATDRTALAKALAFSYLGWIFFALPLYLVAQSIGEPLSLLLAFFIVPASTLAGVVPSPGGSGAVEAALIALLVALTAVGDSGATAIAILYRVASYLFALLVGGVAVVWVVSRN